MDRYNGPESTGSDPPENNRTCFGLDQSRPEKLVRKSTDNAKPIRDQRRSRKHRRLVEVRFALDRSEWDWLYWHSLINEGAP
jgi:hypothetical protein